MSVTGTVTAHNLPQPPYINGYPFVPFSSAGYAILYTLQSNEDGVLQRLESAVQGPGTNPAELILACRWGILILGVGTSVPCTVENGKAVMNHSIYVPQGVIVEVTLLVSANAFAETGSYIFPLTNAVMDDGYGGEVFHFEEGVEVQPHLFVTSTDQVCQTLSTSTRQEAAVITANIPQAGTATVIDIQQGARQTVIDLNIHSCTTYTGGTEFRVNVSQVNWGNTTSDGGTGFYRPDGEIRRVVAYQTQYMNSPSGRSGPWNDINLLLPSSPERAWFNKSFMVRFAEDTSYQLQLDCTDLPLNEEYDMRIEVSIFNVVNPTNRVFTSRFRCVE